MPRSRFRRSVSAVLPTLITLGLMAFVGRWFAIRWNVVMGAADRPAIAWGWIGISALLLILHAGTALAIWRQVLAAVGATITWGEAIDSFVPSLLARYVPGKVWANAMRVGLARRAGVRIGVGAGALLWETLVALGSAGVIAVAGLRGYSATGARSALLLVAGVLSVWIVAAIAVHHPRGESLLHRLGGTNPIRRPGALLPSVALTFLGWACFGAAHLAIVRALLPVGLEAFGVVAGGVALAWAGGYLAIVMPLGLGVRDGLLLVLLAGLLSPQQALMFVAVSRLVQLVVDTSITGLWLVRQITRRTALGTVTR